MSVKRFFSGLCCLLLITPALANNNLWQAKDAAPRLPTEQIACSQTPPKPYTGSLLFESKYNQSDASKSSLRLWPDWSTWRANNQIKDYFKEVVGFARELERKNPKRQAEGLSCLNLWLDSWASAHALESQETTKTGIAARKWALAALASTLLRTQAITAGQYQPSEQQLAWLERLADLVIADYNPRRLPGEHYYNNHDYWAAWAVTAVGLLAQRDDYLAWGFAGLDPVFEQLVEKPDYAYLPYEVARGKLGSDYSHYAMVPITLLVEAREHNQRPLSERERELYLKLANFTARSALQPESLAELAPRQESPKRHKQIWLIPFLSRYPEQYWPRRLYLEQEGDVDGYSQIGGRIKPLYPDLQL